MARTTSSTNARSQPRIDTASSLPPWEAREVVQVPFIDASSPSLSDAERRALSDLWAQPRAPLPTPPKHYDHKARSASTDSGLFHSEHHGSTNSSPPQAIHAPYETPIYVPPPPKTAPPFQKEIGPKAPPTPPESLSNSPSCSNTLVSAPPPPPAVTALPGTMSSRSRENSRHRGKSHRSRSASKHSKSDSTNFGKRFKVAFKDMFKRNPIDESQFERIEDRHWTDEN